MESRRISTYGVISPVMALRSLEVHGSGLLAENYFSFDPEVILDGRESTGQDLSRREAHPHTHLLPTRSVPFSTPVNEPGESSPDRCAREGSGIRFPALC